MSNEIWTPVEDGFEYQDSNRGIRVAQDELAVMDYDDTIWILLPDDLRLCRRVPDNRPRPDWSKAPDWAQWWTVAPERHWHGRPLPNVSWWEVKPYHDAAHWRTQLDPDDNPVGKQRAGKAVEIPPGIDWRTLIEKRPEVTDE